MNVTLKRVILLRREGVALHDVVRLIGYSEWLRLLRNENAKAERISREYR